jgi:hypothetical protein
MKPTRRSLLALFAPTPLLAQTKVNATNQVSGLPASVTGTFDNWIPIQLSAAPNGIATQFILAVAPRKLMLYRGGVYQSAAPQGTILADYTLVGATITFGSGSIPQTGDTLNGMYTL